MVAYNFQKRFVDPIRVGLSMIPLTFDCPPKRQTIRAARAHHAKPGDLLQLYCGMRTKKCFLIGRARCSHVKFIKLDFGAASHHPITIDRHATPVPDEFAQSDGFNDFAKMHEFWLDNHPEAFTENGMMGLFEGVLILWEPLS
jgi:hypothetical protein